MKVLIPAPLTHLPLIAELIGREHEIIDARSSAEDDLVDAVREADAFVATGMDVSARVLAAGSHLQVVGTPQVGFDRIDVEAATRAGVAVISSQGLAATAVAEFALGLMISLSRRINEADRDLRTAGWSSRSTYAEPDGRLGHELRGATVGIVGVGMIGSELGRMARAALDCRVLGHDPVVPADAMAARGIEPRENLVDLASEADFLVLHVPLLPSTHHLVDAELLSHMKPGAFVINVSRGGVVDEKALLAALDAGRIAGGALDVFETEPLPADSPLLARPDLILSPHIGGVTHEWNAQRSRAFAERLLAVLAGERPDGLANPEVWDLLEARQRELVA